MAGLSLPPDASRILDLARSDRSAATRALGERSLAEQAALVCSVPVARRAALLDLAPEPERLVPLLPEAELCFTVKAVGLESAVWLLELATPEQIVASLDLDAWKGHVPDGRRLDGWLDALAATSDDALFAALQAVDPELVVHYLRGRIVVFLLGPDEDAGDLPDGSQTIDGQFHYVVKHDGDDAAPIVRMLRLLFERDYWTYFRLMQGTVWEVDSDNAEWALRWRTGRLQDLGFPPWEEAAALYRYLDPVERIALPADAGALDVSEWHLPVWIPSLPEGRDARDAVFRAIAKLEPDERRAAFYGFLAVANQVAVADHMDLADAETIPRAIAKTALWTSRGLELLAREHALAEVEILRRVPLERLFTTGANLDPANAKPTPAAPTPAEDEAE